jgi:pimeloyl-ACP methyl ester carboxylesterase
MPELRRSSRLGEVPLRLATVAVALSLAYCAFPRDSEVLSAPKRVSEEMFVRIGAIDQWITISGADRNNPVVLVLHGGPGDAASPFSDDGASENDFTFAQWDQRGAGRTYGKSGPSIKPTMTIERMVQDGIEVAGFLIKHLHKKKIIIVGGSWGSILGIHMAHARPDLFYAYVGSAQIVNMRKNLPASYARMLELARASGDQEAITELTMIGSPPWDSLFPKWSIFRKWKERFQAKSVTAPPVSVRIRPAYASPQERAQYAAAEDFSFEHFFGLTMSGPLMNDDLQTLGTDFAIPMFMVQGQEDLTALPELSKAYFDSIKAPRKQFYLVPGTGHEPSAAELELTRKVLIEQVRPLAIDL